MGLSYIFVSRLPSWICNYARIVPHAHSSPFDIISVLVKVMLHFSIVDKERDNADELFQMLVSHLL